MMKKCPSCNSSTFRPGTDNKYYCKRCGYTLDIHYLERYFKGVTQKGKV